MADTPTPPTATPPTPAGEIINVVGQDGQLHGVPQQHLDDVLRSGAFRVATPEEVKSYWNEQDYGGLGQGLAAAGEGALSALTFGVAPRVEEALGVSPEAMAGRKEAHPIAHGAGEVLGVLAPLVATAGASAPASAAEAAAVTGAEALGTAARAARAIRGVAGFTAPALISRAGQAVRGGLEAAEIPGIAGRVLPAAAMAASEGALYGAQDVVERHFLGDPSLTAEKALAEVGLSAMIPGLIVGAGKLAGAAVRPWAEKLIAKGKAAAETKALLEAEKEEASLSGAARERTANAYRQMERIELALNNPATPAEERASLEAFKASPEYADLVKANAQSVLANAPEALAEREAARAALEEFQTGKPVRIAERAAEFTNPARVGELLNDRVVKRYILKRALPGWILGSLTGVGGPVGSLAGLSYGYMSDVLKRIVKDPSMFMSVGRFLKSPIETFSAMTGLSKLAGSTDQAIASGVGAILTGEAGATSAQAVSRAVTSDNFTHVAGNLSGAANDLDRLAETTSTGTEALVPHAPATADAAHALAARVVQHLAPLVPAGPPRLPLSPEHRPSVAELAALNRAVEVAQSPLAVLAHAARGTLDRTHVQALDAIWPRLAGEIRTQLLEKIAAQRAAGKTVPRRSRLAVAMLLGTGLDASTARATVAANQAAFAGAQKPRTPGAIGQAEPGGKGGGRANAIKVPKMFATASQRSQGRDISG